MNKQRMTAVLIAFALILICLAGCKSEPSSNPTETAPSTSSLPTTAAGRPTTASETQTSTLTSASTSASDAPTPVTSMGADPVPNGLPKEMLNGYWVAPLPNYGGSGQEYSLRMIFFPNSILSVDIVKDPAGAINPSNEILASYEGELVAQDGKFRMKLHLEYAGNGLSPSDIPRDEIDAEYRVSYALDAETRFFTLSEPTLDPLLRSNEFPDTTYTLIQEIRPGMELLNPTMVRHYMFGIPEIFERATKQETLAMRVTEETAVIDNINCLLVQLGLHHYGQFVAEYHFFLAPDGRVWEYDPVTDTNKLIWSETFR